MRFILFGTGAERRKEQIWRQIEQLLFGVALSPRCIAAKDRLPPIAGGRRCDPRTRQSNLSELIIDYRLS